MRRMSFPASADAADLAAAEGCGRHSGALGEDGFSMPNPALGPASRRGGRLGGFDPWSGRDRMLAQ